MILPTKIDIQITDRIGKPNPLENVLFGLKIFISEDSWHNYSAFKSDIAGQITLTEQDILANTELKWEKNISPSTTTKFELYVWDGQHTDEIIKITHRLLELYKDKDFITHDLKRHGVLDENIPHAIEVTNNKAIKDKAFYEYIKNAVNNSVHVDTVKIEGIWNDSFQKSYKFIIENTKNGK